MKIKKLETFSNEFVAFVRATSETGAQGWGQVSTYNADITCEIFHRQVARHALGTDALDFADTLNLIGEREHEYPGSYLRRAKAGFKITPHAANLSLVTMCTMHLLRAIPNAGKYLELSIEGLDYYPWQDRLFLGEPYKIVDGKTEVTDAPGWGVEINPDWLDKAAYKCSKLS